MKAHFLLWFFHIPRPQRTSLTMYMYMEKNFIQRLQNSSRAYRAHGFEQRSILEKK